MILQTVRDILRASTIIKNRVDKGTNYPGIYADHGPQSVRGEYIVLQDVTADHHYSTGGEIGTRQTTIQVDCYGENTSKAASLFELVRNRFSGYRGDVVTEAIIVGGLGSDPRAPTDKSNRWTYRYSKDFLVTHLESVPTLT